MGTALAQYRQAPSLVFAVIQEKRHRFRPPLSLSSLRGFYIRCTAYGFAVAEGETVAEEGFAVADSEGFTVAVAEGFTEAVAEGLTLALAEA